MAEENQVMKEPQGKAVQAQQITKEPQGEAAQVQRVTTKNPKKVKAGKRLAESNCKKREVKKQAKLEARGVNQYYDFCHRVTELIVCPTHLRNSMADTLI